MNTRFRRYWSSIVAIARTSHRRLRKRKSGAVTSTPFSNFIRNASSGEKKKVYERVLKKATERQNRVLDKAKSPTK